MKTSSTLQFLTFSFSLFLLSAFFAAAEELVFDSDGQPLRNGNTYKLSLIVSNGETDTEVIGGATSKSPKGDACSLNVIQYSSGWPITIQHLIKPPYISTNHPIILEFAYVAPNTCSNESTWHVVSSPLVDGHKPVMLGDYQGLEFGDDVVKGWFYVKTHDFNKHEYKFVFCHHHVVDTCQNVGVHVDENNWKRLVVRERKTVVFKFNKVEFASHESVLSMVV